MLPKIRKGLKYLFIIALIVVVVLAVWIFILPPSPPPPNVIIYLVDALRPDHLGLYGYVRDTSPFLDELSKQGVIFNNAFSLSAWTRPSVGTLFTSLYPSFHGAVNRDSTVKKSVVTISEVLKKKGYQTAAFLANGNIFGKGLNFEQAFDTFTAIEGKSYRHGSGQEIIDAVTPWIRENQTSPFFLYIHTVDSHDPYFAPPYLRKMFIDSKIFSERESQVIYSRPHISKFINHYDATVRYSDLIFKKFWDVLKGLDLLNNSIIIFLADHGEEFLEHGGLHHGGRLFNEQVRIPVIFWVPHISKLKPRVNAYVRTLDIAPTILSMLKIPSPSIWQGKSLLPVMIGDVPDTEGKDIYFSEELDKFKLYGIRNDQFHYILSLKPEFEESLFDLKKDPYEKENIVENNGNDDAALEDMRIKMMNFIADTSAGYHISYFDATNKPINLTLETDGKFENIISGRNVTVDLNSKENQINLKISQNNDRICFSILPETANLRITNPVTSSDPIPIQLGEKRKTVFENNLEIKGIDQSVVSEYGFPPGLEFKKTGIYLWKISIASREKFKPDEKTIQNLKSLGYIK